MAKYQAVENKILPTEISKPRVIIYDPEHIQYIVGVGAGFEYEPQFMTVENMDGSVQHFPLNSIITMGVNNVECLDNIKLDETLMKRIAVFNKEQQCKRLDEEIREKRKRIKEIEAVLEDREHRLTKLKEFIRHIYELDIDDDDDDWDD